MRANSYAFRSVYKKNSEIRKWYRYDVSHRQQTVMQDCASEQPRLHGWVQLSQLVEYTVEAPYYEPLHEKFPKTSITTEFQSFNFCTAVYL